MRGVQFQSDFFADERVVLAHAQRKVKERAGSIEEDRFDHTHVVFGDRLESQLNNQHLSFGKIIILLSKIAQLGFCGDLDEGGG